jgi:hypothetical protein
MVYNAFTETNRRSLRAITAACLTSAVLFHAATLAASGPQTTSRIRSTNAAMLDLLREGGERSAAFRTLTAAIEQTNGIVYVEFGYCAFGHLDGCLLPFLASTQGERYVRVLVTPDRTRVSHDQLLALIAHELQHAREVLEHPDVVDLTTMDAMYRQIGTPIAGGPRGFETSAARAAGTAVLSELAGHARAPQNARDVAIADTTTLGTSAHLVPPVASPIERPRPVPQP